MSQQDEDDKPQDGEEGEPQEPVEPDEPDVPQDIYYAPEDIQIKILNEHINGSFKRIGKTSDGLGYSHVELECEGKKINSLFNVMQKFQHLRKISFAQNQLIDVSSLQSIKYLTHLNLKFNLITNLDSFNVPDTFPFLEELNLDNNKISNLGQINVPRLKKLILTNNLIKSAESFNGHPTLECLELRNNKLESFLGFQDMPNLKQIWAASNQITTFSHLNNLPKLHTLHLRGNKIVTLDSPPFIQSLYHLNIRANLIEKIDEFNHLQSLDGLLSLTMHENPIANDMGEGVRKEIVMILQKIQRVNKEQISDEERTDALNELKERIAAAIQKQKEEEEEAQRLKEEAEKAAEEARQAELDKQQQEAQEQES